MSRFIAILTLLIFLCSSSLAFSSGGGHFHRGGHSSKSYFSRANHGSHPRTYCSTCARDKRERIKRSASERMKFLKSKGLTHTPKGYQVDHIKPLSKGGEDKSSNMQLIPKNSEKEKNELK